MHDRRHNDWRWLCVGLFLLLTQGGVAASETFVVMEVEGRVEQATGPVELQQLAAEDRVTVRALIGFDRLPEPLRKLVLELRGLGVDALGAGVNEIRGLIDQVEAGTLMADLQQLQALLDLLENHAYLEWTPLASGTTITLNTQDWIRGDGRAVLQAPSGQRQTLTAEKRPSQVGPIGASQDQVPITSATPIVATIATIPVERIWTNTSPSMRVFDHRRPDRGLSLETLEASSIAAMHDAGYVVAGSVQGPGGREVWAARFSADHDLLWSRMLGGAFDLHVTAVTALGNADILIGGQLNTQQAGFLIALNAQGEPRWTQVLGGSENTAVEVPLTLATDATGNALIAGERIGVDRQPTGFVAVITADGQPVWHRHLPATAGVRSAILTDTGWSIAGKSADPSGAPWVGALDMAGHLVWEQLYEDLAVRGAPVLAGLDDGAIALAVRSAEGDGDQLWLRQLAPNGALLQTQQLKLVFGEQDGLETLTRLRRDAEGALWLAGMSLGQDAWLVRLSSTGEALWSGRYGRAALDRFTDLHVRPDGLIAVGHTQSEDSGARGLWIVTLDTTGQLRPAPEYSPSAQDLMARFASSLATLGEEIELGGAPQVSEQSNGHLRFMLPFLRTADGLSDSNESAILDLGWLSVDLTPGATPDSWQVAVDWPKTLFLRDSSGNEIGRLQSGQQRLELDLPTLDSMPSGLDFALDNLQVQVDGQAGLAPIYKTLDLPQSSGSFGNDNSDMGLMTLGALHMTITPKSAPEDARTSSSQLVKLTDMHIQSRSGADTVQLGGMQLSVEYHDLDLGTLATSYGALFGLIESESETPDSAAARTSIASLLQASGQVETALVITDFIAQVPSEGIDYRVGEFSLSAQGAPADETGTLWNLRTRYGLRGLAMREDDQDNSVGSFTFDLAVERLALAAILDIALALAMDQPPAEASLAQAIERPLAGAELGFDLKDLRIAAPDMPPANIDSMYLALTSSDLQSQRPRLALRYNHAGIKQIPDLPPELVPGRVDIDLTLSGLTPSALAPLLLQDEPDPLQLLEQLARHAAQLDIETINIDMPATGIAVTGLARADETATADAPGVIRLNLDLQVRDFDALVAHIGETLSTKEQRDLKVTAALVKLMGDETLQADGSSLHRFEITGDSGGELKINGKDLTPILNALQ